MHNKKKIIKKQPERALEQHEEPPEHEQAPYLQGVGGV